MSPSSTSKNFDTKGLPKASTTPEIPIRILVMGMVRQDGPEKATIIDRGELKAVAQNCGISPDALRAALRRMISDGLIEKNKAKPEILMLTQQGRDSLAIHNDKTRLAWALDSAGHGWDGQWHVVGFGIPERQRAKRDQLRERLLRLGAAAIQPGLYVSAHPWESEVADFAKRIEVESELIYASCHSISVAGETDPRRLSAKLWQLDDLAARYNDFVNQHSWVLESLTDLKRRNVKIADAAYLRGALAMGVAFKTIFDSDPLLPPELLPRPWAGRSARELIVKSRRLSEALRASRLTPSIFHDFDEVLETLI